MSADVVTQSASSPAAAGHRKQNPAQGGALRGAMIRLLPPLLALLVVAGLILVSTTNWNRWISDARIQTTDDATIRANLTGLAARVAGNVRAVLVEDFQRVKAGDMLLEIDPADYRVAVAQEEAVVAGLHAALLNLDNQAAQLRAGIAQAEAQLASARAREVEAAQELRRQQDLLRSTFGTRQKTEQATAALASGRAAVQAAMAAVEAERRQLDVLDGTRRQRQADLQAAQAVLEGARLKLSYTRIIAPFDGVVGQRQVQPGDYVTVGSALISIVPLPQVHVIANYKETQLTRVAPGQPVEISVDTFPGAVLRGHVERISPATGSQFALLPPDNATGNFTKVVQRIPVRITIDPGQALQEQLRPGMSVITRIDTSGTERQP